MMQVQVLILHECVLPERKSKGAHRRIPSCVLVMTPKQTIHQARIGNDTENSQEDHQQGEPWPSCRPKPARQRRYWYQDRNSGAEMDKETTPHKSLGYRPLILKPALNALMLPAICPLWEKKRRSNPNSSPVCSKQRPDVHTKQKTGQSLSILTTGPCRKSWNLLTSLSQELKLFDKWTLEHQEYNRHHHPFPLLPPPNKERMRYHHLQNKKRL